MPRPRRSPRTPVAALLIFGLVFDRHGNLSFIDSPFASLV